MTTCNEFTKAKLVAYSQPAEEFKDQFKSIKDLVAYCARVSNPSNQFNTETSDKLINYLLKHKHFSPFEMASITLEVETTRDIARQLLRHRSFTFQEFCVTGDTMITLELPGAAEKGKRSSYKRSIEHLYNLQQKGNLSSCIRVYDEDTKTFVNASIKEVFKTGVKPVFKITLANGKSISATKDHKFFTQDGFKTMQDIIGLVHVGNTTAMSKKAVIACKSLGNRLTVDWSEVVSVEFLGDQMTYDLEVNHVSHNYVGNGILTHNSQRYADPTKDLNFVTREARLQDPKNRQNSVQTDDRELIEIWEDIQVKLLQEVKKAYTWAVTNGIAKEQARSVLPEGLTMSRLYVQGTVRSFIHYLDVRCEEGTQLEHRILAQKTAQAISKIFDVNIAKV